MTENITTNWTDNVTAESTCADALRAMFDSIIESAEKESE